MGNISFEHCPITVYITYRTAERGKHLSERIKTQEIRDRQTERQTGQKERESHRDRDRDRETGRDRERLRERQRQREVCMYCRYTLNSSS